MVARMSLSARTMYSAPSLSYILSPAYLKYITLSPFLVEGFLTSSSSPSLPSLPSTRLPGPTETMTPVQGFSTAPSVSMMPPAVVVDTVSVLSMTRSPSGVSLGMSFAVAPDPGKVPMRSSSRMRMYVSPPISMSTQPMPNLLYRTVTPFFMPTHLSPNSATSPVD